ncbi:hypothetical protein ILUMI_04577 [Ignelater luminosus]|uniref:Reverse transcriptase domain-containing protein n=1 Tax=Ignelater luminosus TaxID=2038154 RepID=A0A8K0GEE8_IGNLU|nr:hypothetical protein ILUMI_04577 [Ignelater luminosus]
MLLRYRERMDQEMKRVEEDQETMQTVNTRSAFGMDDPSLYQVFTDFKQAYDRTQRKPLYSAMKEIGIQDKLIRLTRITMTEAKGIVKIQQHTSEGFEIKQSLRQADGLASYLLISLLIRLSETHNIDAERTILYKETQIVGYPDNLDLTARLKRAPREGYKPEQKSVKIGLEINVNKTKTMEIKTGARLGQSWAMANDNIEVVQELTYLGSNLNSNNDITQKIPNRTKRATEYFTC